MNPAQTSADVESSIFRRGLPPGAIFAAGFAGAGCLHLAYAVPRLGVLLLGSYVSFAALSLARTKRKASYPALLIGLALYAPQLGFFWTIFGPPAIALWLVLAYWLGFFSLIAWRIRTRWGVNAWLLALPILWTGLEYFRSELYYLRFSWINAGYALAPLPALSRLIGPGMYGVGFVLMSAVSLCFALKKWSRWIALAITVGLLGLLTNLPPGDPPSAMERGQTLHVAGIQAEFPRPDHVTNLLDKALARFPRAELLVLSEYTFLGPVPEPVKNWCRQNGKYLIAGGKEAEGADFYNTAFVVSPAGDVVFRQAKAVPIQFFADGLPAREQKVWNSPWGRLGICICYDLSYARVVDQLVRQGAQAIINPTMDVMDWGRHQHQLHSRVPPVRAAEYGIPIFRVASSGISQLVDRRGCVVDSAPFGADEAVVGGELQLASPGRRPPDRWLAPVCVGLTGILLILCFVPDRHPAAKSISPATLNS